MDNRQQQLRSLENRVNQLTQEVNHKMANTQQRGAGVCLFKPKKTIANDPTKACPKGWTPAGHSLFGGLELNKGHNPTNFCVYKNSSTSCPDGFSHHGTLGPTKGSICAWDGGNCDKLSKKKGYKKYHSVDIADYISEFTK